LAAYADLLISLHAHDAETHRVEASLRLPDSDARTGISVNIPRFGVETLRTHLLKPDAYGQTLTDFLFADGELTTFFAEARIAAKSQKPPVSLRLRLQVGPTLLHLHDLRWETLRNPQEPHLPLATDENILFSRYLTSKDRRPVRSRHRSELKALVVIANPADLGRYSVDGRQLEPVDVPGELARAKTGLGPIPITALCSADDLGCSDRPTLNNLLRHLRDGYDVLYLVCHGALSKEGMPRIYLEDDDGNTDIVTGDETTGRDGRQRPGLVGQLAQLQARPLLVVLASCQSAGEGGAFTSHDRGSLACPGRVFSSVPAVTSFSGNHPKRLLIPTGKSSNGCAFSARTRSSKN
jgi:hypothetical protein